MINTEKLNEYIDKQIEYWQPHGALAVNENGQTVLTRTYGFSDKENTRPITADEKYFFTFSEFTFPALALLLLIDRGEVKFTDTLDKYIPEYSHAKEIRIKWLFDASAAIECWYNGTLMVEFDKDEAHKALPIEQRMPIEKEAFVKDRTFAEKLALINDKALVDIPGNNPGEWGSYTYATFMQEIVERLSGKTLFAFLKENLFDKFDIAAEEGNVTTADGFVMHRDVTPVFIPKTPSKNGVTLTLNGLNTLAQHLCEKEIFSEKMWKQLLKFDDYGMSYLFEFIDGWTTFSCFGAEGFGTSILFNAKRKTYMTFVCTRDYKYELINGSWYNFIRRIRSEVQAQIVYPLAPKMVKFGMQTWEGSLLTVRDDQKDFVSDAKSSLCWAYADKHTTSYVLMDDGVAIGLLVLKINKKKNVYYVGVVQIDQRYQGRGYGRFLMDFAVETLKNAGAKELTIGVNRNNVAARRLYESCGFKAAEVYDGGVFMKLKLE